jgi:hypothetical protein
VKGGENMPAYKIMTRNEYDKLKSLLRSMSIAQIEEATGRSGPTLGLIRKTDDFNMYSRVRGLYSRGKESGRPKTYTQILAELKDSPRTAEPTERNLDSALQALDQSIEKVKQDIATLIQIGVQTKMKEELNKKDALIREQKREIEQYKEVVNAARGTNWADSIKRSLIGG